MVQTKFYGCILFMVKWLKILLKDMCKIHIKDSLHTGGLIRKFHQHLGGPKTWRPSPGGLLISSVRENQIHNYILRPLRPGNVGFHTKESFLITKYDKYIWKFLKSFIFLGLKMHKVRVGIFKILVLKSEAICICKM